MSLQFQERERTFEEPSRLAFVRHRAREILARDGAVALAKKVVRRAAAPVMDVSSVWFFVRDLDEPLPSRPDVPGFTLLDVSREDVKTYREGFDPSQTEAALVERLRRGHRSVLFLGPDGRPAHSRWHCVTRAYVPEIGLDVELGPGEAYFYNSYTHPDYRRRGFDGLARCILFEYLKAQGCRRVYSYARGSNAAAIRAAHRWQRPVGRVRYLRLGRTAPIVLGSLRRQSPALVATLDGDADPDSPERRRAWKQWFESWQQKPLTMRSTGYHHSSETYLKATADAVVSMLDVRSDDRVLDLGCDSAMVTRFVTPRAGRLVGVDLYPALLEHGVSMHLRSASGRPSSFLAASGDELPFRSGAFDKAYCCGVLQTLPSREYGLAVIEELVRVTAPGGVVLVGAIPDRAKLPNAVAEAWRRAGPSGKLRLAASLALPGVVKRALRRAGVVPATDGLTLLEYDLGALKRRLELHGLECRILDYPESYPSRDFRRTRSNLQIFVPESRVH